MKVASRDYYRCPECQATFLDSSQLPSEEFERTRYLLHRNDVHDDAYRRFLNRLAAPLLQRLPQHCHGLDYGCGPGAALADMLREAGHVVELYDPYFAPDPGVLQRTYGFVTCTEAAEHFHRPAKEFHRIDAMLRPGGWLGLMTTFQTEDERFADWYYRRDPTHVVFYRMETMMYLARLYGWRCEFPGPNVALMQKNRK